MNAAVLLRQKVLDLAIRGKLTQREKDDEPASALLARIVAEKEKRSAQAGKVRTPTTPQPIIDEETPFELPKGWAWCRMRILGEFFGGHTPSLSNLDFWEKGNVLWVTSKDMKTKYIEDTGVKVSRKGAAELRLLPVGAVLMVTRSGILRRTFPVALAAKPLTINQDQRALVLYEPLMSEYVYVLLKAMEPIILKDYRKTGTTVESILWEKFIDMPIPLPPLAEQKRIVERIDELLAAIDQYSAAMGKISNAASLMEKKVLDLAIHGKLSKQEKGDGSAAEIIADIEAENAGKKSDKKRKDKALPPITPDDEVFDLPENWTWCRMGSLVEIVSGVSYQKGDIRNDGVRILRGGNLKEDNHLYLNDDDVFISKSYANVENAVHKGDIVIVASTGSATVIGRPAIAEADMPGVQIGAFLRIVRSRKEELAKWLQLIFRSNFYRNHIRESSKGTNINNLKNEYMTEFCIPLPPLAEQERIVERVDAILAECRKVSR